MSEERGLQVQGLPSYKIERLPSYPASLFKTRNQIISNFLHDRDAATEIGKLGTKNTGLC